MEQDKFFYIDRNTFRILAKVTNKSPRDAAMDIIKSQEKSDKPITVSLLKAQTKKLSTFVGVYDTTWKMKHLGTFDLSYGEHHQFLNINGLNASHKKKRN